MKIKLPKEPYWRQNINWNKCTKKHQTRTILKTKLSVETSAQKTTIHPNLIWKNVMCRVNFKLDWTK